MCVNSKGSGKTVRLRRLAWAFAGLCDKYYNLMSWLVWSLLSNFKKLWKASVTAMLEFAKTVYVNIKTEVI